MQISLFFLFNFFVCCFIQMITLMTYKGATGFITTCQFGQVKYKFNVKHLPKLHFHLPQKDKFFVFVLKVMCPQYTFSLPDSSNCYFLVFQITAARI